MMRPRRVALVVGCLVVAIAVAVAVVAFGGANRDRAPDRAATSGTASATWEKVVPGGRTRTARGGPYAFWVRRGDPRRLLLYFQEGGGCFSFRTCAPGSWWFDDAVDDGDDPSGQGGMLDRFNARNPFGEFTAVFIPSATGDVHWGDARVTYRAGGRSVTVEHRGFVNAMSGVRWAFRNVPDPRSVFVTGCSAGSVGSAAFAPYVIRRYPHARVAQLGDSLAFVFSRPLDLSDLRAYGNMPRWIPAVRALRPGRHTMADYYVAIARYYREATFAQFNYASDHVQQDFYGAAAGRDSDFDADLRASIREIHAGAPNFRSFTAPGAGHCILPDATFYTLRRGGISMRDWTARLAAGRRVGDIR